MREFPISSDLKFILDVYNKCGFSLTNLKSNPESRDYDAYSFELNGERVEYRISKITPIKTGQFVTIWKRNQNGITTPYDTSDNFDLVIITSKSGNKIGQFIFPKSVLVEKGIISNKGKQGKRGIRVYPPWDNVTSKQAEQTQRWQTDYFVLIETNNATLLELTRKLNPKFQNNSGCIPQSDTQTPSK